LIQTAGHCKKALPSVQATAGPFPRPDVAAMSLSGLVLGNGAPKAKLSRARPLSQRCCGLSADIAGRCMPGDDDDDTTGYQDTTSTLSGDIMYRDNIY
jgi:hypothetical protein